MDKKITVRDILNLMGNLCRVQIVQQVYDEDFNIKEVIRFSGNVYNCTGRFMYTCKEVVYISVDEDIIKLYIDDTTEKKDPIDDL